LDKENLAVVAAMVLGDKTQLDGAQREAYSLSGASHVLALSGLHLSIIFSFLNFVTFRRRNKTVRSILLISAIWMYAFLVGLMPSVVRSAIMLSVMTLVGITGRNSFSLNVLSFAAIIMLLLNPLSLYDIGFQLSFIAVAFIVTFCRNVTSIISVSWIINHPVLNWLWQLLVVSLLAQLGTMPLVLYYFGNLPLLSLPLSFIIIPATTLILYLSLMFILIGWLPYIGAVIARVLSLVVEFQNSVVEYVVSLPFSVQTGINVSPWQTIVLYGILLCFLLLIIKSKSLIKS
jgi:competence protein ComEC